MDKKENMITVQNAVKNTAKGKMNSMLLTMWI